MLDSGRYHIQTAWGNHYHYLTYLFSLLHQLQSKGVVAEAATQLEQELEEIQSIEINNQHT